VVTGSDSGYLFFGIKMFEKYSPFPEAFFIKDKKTG
jgi:hypothetical protein